MIVYFCRFECPSCHILLKYMPIMENMMVDAPNVGFSEQKIAEDRITDIWYYYNWGFASIIFCNHRLIYQVSD